MSNLPIQFLDKVNSPELLAYLQQFGEKSYLSAEEINQIRDAINELAQGSLPDAVLKTGTISITGLAVNIEANAYAWRINQQSFLNPPSYGVNLTAAANGFYRADIIVGTSTGTYQVVQGNPSATTAIEPNTPEGTIRLAGVVVFGMVVGQPTPTPTTSFIEKSERANVVLTGSGVINQLDLVDEKATIVFKGSITRLNTISYASVPYNGKRITLFNAQATPVTIGHSVSGYGVDFVFASGQDYVLAPNETIEFSFDITYAPYAHHMLIGSKGITNWSELQGKPSTFPPSAHTHTVSQITDFPMFKTIENQSIVGAGNIDLNKSDVGLSNVDNTSDLNKPISTATQTALNGKEPIIPTGTALQYIKGDKTLGTFPTVPTVDQTIINGSTNAVSGKAVFDGLALKADISQLHNPVTIGTANGLSLSTQQLSLGLASSGVTGALSGTDWNTFNGKFPTPSGLTTNYLPKWNGSGFGNSKIFDNNVGISFGGSTFFGGYEFLTPAFGNNTIYIGTPDGTQNPRAYISHQTVSNQPQKVVLGSAFSAGQATASWYLENGRFVVGSLDDNGVDKLQVNGSGSFSGNITASPAVSPNQVVVKSQLDAVASSGSYTPNLVGVTNVTSISIPASGIATFTKIGNIVNVMVSVSVTPTTASSSVNFTISLPVNRSSTALKYIGLGSCLNLSSGSNVEISSSSTNTATVLFLISANASTRIVTLSFQYDITQ